MKSNSLCTKVIPWMKFDEIDVFDKIERDEMDDIQIIQLCE
jgi:hypothetical protein